MSRSERNAAMLALASVGAWMADGSGADIPPMVTDRRPKQRQRLHVAPIDRPNPNADKAARRQAKHKARREDRNRVMAMTGCTSKQYRKQRKAIMKARKAREVVQ